MKVIHILHELKFSGAEIMYVDAAPIFQELGCELSVMATTPQLGEYATYFQKAGYEVLHKPYPPLKKYFSRAKYYYKFIGFLKKNNYDIVHIHDHGCMWGMSLCTFFAGKKAIHTFHNVFPGKKSTYLYHLTLRWSAKHLFKCKFHTISDSVYEHELNNYFNSTTKIYNWYGDQRFYPAAEGEKEKIRKELNIQADTLAIISIGGCSHIKRHSDIINSLPTITEKIPNCIYLHLGNGQSEAEEILLSKKLEITEFIRFYGNKSDVRKYLIASDIYLMTSKFEGISLTTIEAMACNIPAILYNVAGLRDFNKEGEISILIPEDYNILAQKVIELYENKPKADKLISDAKIFIDKNYSLNENARKIFQLYCS